MLLTEILMELMILYICRLQLEVAKNDTLNKKKTRELEAIRYENMKKNTGRSHERLRDELIDNKIKNDTRETQRILRMRAKLERDEQIQDSQKLLLQHLQHADKALEELAIAAQNGNLEKCRELIRAGNNVNEPDSAGFLPLHYACLSGSIPVATMLLKHGSDVSSYLTGMSPMEISAKNGHEDLIQLLQQYGADVEDGGAGGSPPIVSACCGGHLNCIEALINLGADINAGDLEGLTALHMTTRLKAPKAIIKILIANGADKTRISRKLLTPLQLALSVLNVQAIEALGGKNDPSDIGNNSSDNGKNNTQKNRDLTKTIAEVKAANANALSQVPSNAGTNSNPRSDIIGPQGSVFSAVTLESNSFVSEG